MSDLDTPAGGSNRFRPISRRTFLRYAGITGLLVTTNEGLSIVRALAAPDGFGGPPPGGVFTRTIRRREDLFVATFEFRNLRFEDQGRKLVKNQGNFPSYLGVVLQPQHMTEEAFPPDGPFDPPGLVDTRLAAPSRVAFRIPDSLFPLDFDLDTLLDWDPLALQVVPAATVGLQQADHSLRAPSVVETAIELPWFLILSPTSLQGFVHEPGPVTHAGRTELWHTRLGGRIGNQVKDSSGTQPLLAVWARDKNFDANGINTEDDGPFEPPLTANALTPYHRNQIVRLTSDHNLTFRKPAQAKRLMLSSLGGWLDARGTWDPPQGGDFDIEEWVHQATMGRDHYVKVVQRGFLAPLGHKAVFIQISERRFRDVGGGNLAAYLLKRFFVVVREPVKQYGSEAAPGQPKDGRQFPFRSVHITTTTTPDLNEPGPTESELRFLPRAGTQPVLFSVVGTDWTGQETAFTTPLLFISQAAVSEDEYQATLNFVNGHFGQTITDIRRRPINGQRIAFAPEKEQGDTSFDVAELVMTVLERADGFSLGDLAGADQFPFYPAMQEAKVRLAAAEQTAGQVLEQPAVKIAQQFIEHGFTNQVDNLGEVFLEKLPGADTFLDFAKDTARTGGLATPNFDITGITRRLGPVGGALENLATGKFDPLDYLDPAAKLLGSLKLSDVIAVLENLEGVLSTPLIKTKFLPEQPEPPAPPVVPQKLLTTLDWKPTLKPDQPLQIFKPEAGASLTLHAETIADLLNPDNSTFTIVGDLRNCAIQLIGESSKFMVIHVKRMKFTAGKDAAPDLDLTLGKIEFVGPLKFVEELKNLLTSLGKKYGIDVTAEGITAALALPLPSISVGVFSLQNMSLGIGAVVPFNGDAARVRFAFCSRENPFILTVSMFGGGGFFALEAGTDKSVMLEVAVEFGAAIAFDIGVASGGVEVMAGIYIKIENDDAELTGYLRMSGELGILGIIRILCELYLGFTYFSATNKTVGTATFHLEVEILIFSFSINATVERKFGGENDPTFAQFMSPDNWTEYCEAYAPIGA